MGTSTQVELQYQKLWHCLLHKPSDQAINDIIKNALSEDEAEQLKMRFGLTDGSPTPLVETANRLEMGEDSVRDGEAVALTKLRTALARSLLA